MDAPRTFAFLGTGTSVGVPMVGCSCDVCRSDDPRNHRYRCSVLITTPNGRILIDTPPELRLQLLRERADRIDAVLYTHSHADHLFGLDDLRPFSAYTNQPIPLYCTEQVETQIRTSFAYAFPTEGKKGYGYIPRLVFHRIDPRPFEALGQQITPIPLEHASYSVFGFRIANVAYCTDVNRIPDESMALLANLDVLVLDALRHKPHPAHFSLDQALEVIQQLRPRQAYLTHMGHDIEHESVTRQLPSGVALAYDGLRFSF